jgi:WS/DGAT/MGAT family acyltransferase
MSGRRTIGAVDAVWLAMDRPDNLMVIDSIMWFDEPADWTRLADVVQHRLVDRYPVFRQRVVEPSSPLGTPHWEDDADFSLDRHLRRAVLPSPGDDRSLQQYVEAQMCRPLDRAHPLWEVHLLDGYGSGSAVLTRFHHALADGMALAEVLLSLTDEDASGDADPLRDSASGRTDRGVLGGLTAAVSGASRLVPQLPRTLSPAHLVDLLLLAGRTGMIADKLLLSSNPETPLSGAIGPDKRAVWSAPRRLADVKCVGRLAGATVNDVLVASVSGALAAYLEEHGGERTDLTTMVPVNLRPPGAPLPRELGNQFALVMLPLATGAGTALQRLSESKRRMDRIKGSPEATLTFGIINALGRTNRDLARLVVDFFAAKAIGVTTNVAGPRTARYLAGTKIAGVLGWVPGSGEQTVGVCIFSYDGTVRVGFKVDAAVVSDPQSLVHAFEAELDTLLRIARAA